MRENRKHRGILRGILLALVTAVFLAVSAGAGNAYAYENTTGIVKDGGTRIRSSSSTDSTVLASVLSGDKLEICGMETGADGYTWYKVYVDRSTIGYVRSDRITDTGEKTGGVTNDNVTGNAGQNTGTAQPDDSQTPQDPITDAEQPQDPDAEPSDQTEVVPDNTVTTPAVTGAKLQSIGLGNTISMSPAFSPDITEYTILVDENTESISVFGVPAEGATVTENYGFDNLQRGSNMAVITVQAADGSTTSYNFMVNRGEASAEIHYSQPGTGADTTQNSQPETQTVVKKGVSSGWVVFLAVIIIAMAAVMVMMGLRVRDYRRELYGEDPEEFHLEDALPDNSVFRGIKAKRRPARAARESYDEEEPYDDGEAYDEEEPYEDGPDQTAAYEDAADNDNRNREQNFMYDVRKSEEDAAQIQDPGMQYHETERAADRRVEPSEADLEPDDDELEDIMERNATITDQESGKDVWKSVNFMTPADDLEFEFLKLDDENE